MRNSYIILILFFTFVFNLNAATISKAFHHSGQCKHKLVFYLDQKPRLTHSGGVGHQEYTLHDVSSSTVRSAIDNIQNKKYSDHKVLISRNGKNLNIRIMYNPRKVAKVVAAIFRPISKPWGLSIETVRFGETPKKTCMRKVSKVRKAVVIDFGHGGRDPGTTVGGLQEKQIVSDVGMRLVKILESKGYLVYLTRDRDVYVPLDKRTSFANLSTGAHLFVSLHANYSGNPKVSGIETYYMSHGLFEPIGGIHRDKDLLNKQSALLASQVHSSVINQAKKKHLDLVDRKVKQSVSQVLMGVEMPAILIELGFLSNPKEASRLNSASYQNILAAGIGNGINAYFT